MRNNLELTLPKSGHVAVIRSYVKNRDRKKVQYELLSKQTYDLNGLKNNTEMLVDGSVLASSVETQCRCLLISVNGVTENPYDLLLDSEHEEDLALVEKTVANLFNKGQDHEKK